MLELGSRAAAAAIASTANIRGAKWPGRRKLVVSISDAAAAMGIRPSALMAYLGADKRMFYDMRQQYADGWKSHLEFGRKFMALMGLDPAGILPAGARVGGGAPKTSVSVSKANTTGGENRGGDVRDRSEGPQTVSSARITSATVFLKALARDKVRTAVMAAIASATPTPGDVWPGRTFVVAGMKAAIAASGARVADIGLALGGSRRFLEKVGGADGIRFPQHKTVQVVLRFARAVGIHPAPLLTGLPPIIVREATVVVDAEADTAAGPPKQPAPIPGPVIASPSVPTPKIGSPANGADNCPVRDRKEPAAVPASASDDRDFETVRLRPAAGCDGPDDVARVPKTVMARVRGWAIFTGMPAETLIIDAIEGSFSDARKAMRDQMKGRVS
jgi:hypothetical protein